jgi:spermidine synthase
MVVWDCSMGLLSYFWDVTRLHTSSFFNKDIRVVEINGQKRLLVNGIQQTGPYDDHMFKQAFTFFGIHKLPVLSRVLVLGLGGGYVVRQLSTWFPHAHFVCVDIDTNMIAIAKEQFGLKNIKNVTYVTSDAEEFVTKQKNIKESFDLVIVDLYIGDTVAAFVSHTRFLSSVAKLVSRDGRVLINYQGAPVYNAEIHKILTILKGLFHRAEYKIIYRNAAIFAVSKIHA